MSWLNRKIFGRSDQSVVMDGTVVKETDKAYLIKIDAGSAWLPKKEVQVSPLKSGGVRISIPEWLFVRKFPA